MGGKKLKKVCFASSSGGHLEQILALKKDFKLCDSFVVTEKTKFNNKNKGWYYLNQVNRKDKFIILKLLFISIHSLLIYFKERPQIIITTGVLATIPLCLIARFFKTKIIYIESFAKITSPTETGKFMYKHSDMFIVQWKEMLKFYPNAKFFGGIY